MPGCCEHCTHWLQSVASHGAGGEGGEQPSCVPSQVMKQLWQRTQVARSL